MYSLFFVYLSVPFIAHLLVFLIKKVRVGKSSVIVRI
nr:MAG TPA: hypothetical protein [Caudoviricetes sp.]